jgi:hypothetical protein
MVTVLSKPKPFAWSYSALNQFENCARQYYHSKVAKDFPEVQNEAHSWGLQVHKELAHRIRSKSPSPLPENMKQFQKWVPWAKEGWDPEGEEILAAEEQMAITQEIEPCEYFDRRVDPWFRTVLDVMRIDGPCARIIDWKTGRNVNPDSDQLKLAATVVFAHYPQVQRAQCQFVWLQEDSITEKIFWRKDLIPFWVQTVPRVERMRIAVRDGDFPCRPSGLCKRHCGVKTCEHWGKGRHG